YPLGDPSANYHPPPRSSQANCHPFPKTKNPFRTPKTKNLALPGHVGPLQLQKLLRPLSGSLSPSYNTAPLLMKPCCTTLSRRTAASLSSLLPRSLLPANT